MSHPLHGKKLDESECPGCGAIVPVKVNSAGGVYFFCAAVVGMNPKTEKAERCYTRLNVGRTGSEKIIREFLQNKGDITENVQETNQHEQPAEPEQPGGSTATTGAEQPGIEPASAAEPEQRSNPILDFFTK